MGGPMTIYVFTDSRGTSHDIKQQHIEEAYRTLIQAGYSMHEAHDKALDYVLAQIQLSSVAQEDLLYNNHDFQTECAFTSLVAHRLMMKQTQKETNNETTQTA
jgi:hypothetical protein